VRDATNPLDGARNIAEFQIEEIVFVTSITMEVIRKLRSITYEVGPEKQVAEPALGRRINDDCD